MFDFHQLKKTQLATSNYSLRSNSYILMYMMGFPGGSVVKEYVYNAGDMGLIPGSGRSPGEGNGNPLQYSFLEKPMDRGDWRATVHRISKESDTTERLN